MSKLKLELTWIGKEKRPKLKPRILLEDARLRWRASCGGWGLDSSRRCIEGGHKWLWANSTGFIHLGTSCGDCEHITCLFHALRTLSI
jgi:hypothetical protein